MRPPLPAFTFLCVLACCSVAQPAMDFLRREVPWGQGVRLEDFGAPPIEVSVRSRQVSFVTVDIADYTRMVPVVVNDSTIYGPSRVVMQPARITRRVERKNGTRDPGGRSDMYLLHIEPESGVQVYFSDEAVGQNLDMLVVGVPRGLRRGDGAQPAEAIDERRNGRIENGGANASAAPIPGLEPTPAAAAKSDGYLSDKLLDWYLRLEEKRERLDPKNTEAVQRFNEEAARYQAEVKRARDFNKTARGLP